MPFRYRDVNGPHQCCTENPQMFARVSRLTARLAWKDHGSGYAYLEGVNTGVITEGNNPVAWGDDDALYIQTDQSGRLLVLRPDGAQDRVDAPYRSEGIHHIAPDGTPVMGGGAHVTVREVELWNAMQDADGAWCGLSNGGGPFGCVAWIPANGPALMCVVSQDVPLPPKISNGVVVWSGLDSPDPANQAWEPFRVYVPPAPVLTVPANPRPMIRGTFGIPNLPNSNVGGSGHPLNVIEGFPSITEADKPKLRGVIWDVTNKWDTSRDDAIKLCKATGAALVCYDDGHDISKEMDAAAADGVAVVHARCEYPNLAINPSPYPKLCVSAVYSGWSDDDVAHELGLNMERLETLNFLGELFAGCFRNAPQAPKPWALDYAKQRCLTTPAPDWSTWPKTPKPVAVEPPPVSVVPPVPPKKSQGNAKTGGPGWVLIESRTWLQKLLGIKYRKA